MYHLNLNIDHFATLRNARGGKEPNPVTAALAAEIAGVSGIVTHLRKDRRHIKDEDVLRINDAISTKLNLEMSDDSEIMDIACKVKPAVSTIVPEMSNEITTSRGLDVVNNFKHLKECTTRLHGEGIKVSLFIEPNETHVKLAADIGADIVEFNTLQFAIASDKNDWKQIGVELDKMNVATECASDFELYVAAGHSLNYQNIKDFCLITDVLEYNIGHSIVARASIVGIQQAVKDMLELFVIYKHHYFSEQILL